MAQIAKLPPYRTLDAWRGFGCMAVLLFHGFRAVGGKYPGILQGRPGAAGEYGYLGVQLFFVISGYCIAHAAISSKLAGRSIVSYFKARVRRIFPPYWFCIPFYVLTNEVGVYMRAHGHAGQRNLNYISVFHQPARVFLANLFLLQEPTHQPLLNGIAWTLCYEVAFYLMVGAALLLAFRAGTDWLLLILHVFTAGCLAGIILAPFRSVPFPFDMWPQFGLGVLAYDVLRNRDAWRARTCCVAVLLMTAGAIVKLISADPVHWWGALPRRHEALDLVVSLVFALVITILHPFDRRMQANHIVAAFAWLGLFSYSTYLLHSVVQAFVSYGAKMAGLPAGPVMPYVLLGVMSIICVGCSWVFFWFCERPFMNAATRPATPPQELHLAPTTSVA